MSAPVETRGSMGRVRVPWLMQLLPWTTARRDGMVENRPWLTVFSHAVLILGIVVVAFPLYVTFVASTLTLEQIQRIVEKPRPEEAPSTLAVVGRYILTPRIFHHLAHVGKGSGGEIQLTDGIAALLAEEQVLAYRYKGTRYDCGSKLGYLEATVAFGLRHAEVGKDFAALLKKIK